MRFIHKYLLCFITMALCCLQEYCLSQSSTVRPYKFGFTIDQQQHRSEQRDERGIVMGEFGFITADGIYHVTVYATDEQGRFRILAMKNYPYESPPKTVEVMVKPKMTVTTTTTTTPKPLARHNFNTQACSGCFLRNGDDKPKDVNAVQEKTMKNGIRPLSKNLPNQPNAPASPKFASQPSSASKPTEVGTGLKPASQTTTDTNNPPIMDIIMQKILPTLMGSKDSTTKTLNNKPNVLPSTKKSVSSSGSGTTAGTNDDGDLYRFKYILDYHGHSETGKRNGNKEGTYYSIGDDNVERTIEYVANEFGYQPRIRWRKLNANEIKSKENTLKDYEFVWFN